MARKWLYCLLMSGLIASFASMGCRAPYPTYNPYGFYGQPCVNPPGTGAYNPTGRVDPYYGAPNNGVYPPNPYAPNTYQGYPPPAQTPATSQRQWTPQPTSTRMQEPPSVQPQNIRSESLVTSADNTSADNEGWQSVDNPNSSPEARTAMLDTSTNPASSAPPTNNLARFDGFGRN